MNSNKKTGRIIGLLLLLIFIAGIAIYQFLRGPFVFSDDYLMDTSTHANEIIISIILAFLSGLLSIFIAKLLFPIFKKYSLVLASTYLVLCILNFVAISYESYNAYALMELGNEFVTKEATDDEYLKSGAGLYENHRDAHYYYLLISCLPVFVLYYGMFLLKLIPKGISIFGMIAAILMFIDVLSSILGENIGGDLMIPMGLVQLFLPFWLMIRGFKEG